MVLGQARTVDRRYKITAIPTSRNRRSFGTSSSNVTISSTCCMGVGFLSIRLVRRQSRARRQALGVLCQESEARSAPYPERLMPTSSAAHLRHRNGRRR